MPRRPVHRVSLALLPCPPAEGRCQDFLTCLLWFHCTSPLRLSCRLEAPWPKPWSWVRCCVYLGGSCGAGGCWCSLWLQPVCMLMPVLLQRSCMLSGNWAHLFPQWIPVPPAALPWVGMAAALAFSWHIEPSLCSLSSLADLKTCAFVVHLACSHRRSRSDCSHNFHRLVFFS